MSSSGVHCVAEEQPTESNEEQNASGTHFSICASLLNLDLRRFFWLGKRLASLTITKRNVLLLLE